jgi:hypothetical protein
MLESRRLAGAHVAEVRFGPITGYGKRARRAWVEAETLATAAKRELPFWPFRGCPGRPECMPALQELPLPAPDLIG